MEFKLTTTIKASARDIYNTWLSSEGHSNMTGGSATTSDEIGANFTAWDGYISGKNINLEPHHRIVQSWRSSDFEAHEPDSQIEVLLFEKDGQTELTLIHSNVPGNGDDYEEGWEEHYFEPMKAYFSNK